MLLNGVAVHGGDVRFNEYWQRAVGLLGSHPLRVVMMVYVPGCNAKNRACASTPNPPGALSSSWSGVTTCVPSGPSSENAGSISEFWMSCRITIDTFVGTCVTAKV